MSTKNLRRRAGFCVHSGVTDVDNRIPRLRQGGRVSVNTANRFRAKPATLLAGVLVVTGSYWLALPAAAGQGRFFQRTDANGDGAIQLEELSALRGEMFERLDRDGDGYVTAAELQQARQRAAANQATLLQRADGDGDGRVSRQEFLQAPMPLFERADGNGDGALTADEFRQFISQVRQSR